MIKTPMSNKFAVLGEMEEAQSQKKEMILSQYKLISSILENCMQLEEDGAVREVLQKQAETIKLLQKGELPKQSENTTLKSKVNTLETKLDHLVTTCDAIHKATTTALSSSPSIPSSPALPSSSSVNIEPKTYAQAAVLLLLFFI